MKKLLALVLSMLLVASCFALVAVAAEDTTAADAGEETTVAGEETTVAGDETTEGEAPSFSNTLIVFDENAQAMKILGSPNGINRTYYKSDWEGARLKLTDVGDPYVTINFSTYIKKTNLEKVDSQAYPFIVFKLKIEGYVDDIELFYAAGDISAATGGYSTTTDYPCECSGEVEYIIYDLTDDCEGTYNLFRFDPMGADEETMIYLYEMAMFATIEEAEAYAQIEETEAPETEATTEEVTTEAKTEEKTTTADTRPPREEKKDCNGVIGVGTIVAIVSLGIVCIKKKD